MYLPRITSVRSRRVFVFVQEAAEAVAATDAEPAELDRVGDRFGQRDEWPGVGRNWCGRCAL
jgi:hypothetical protein